MKRAISLFLSIVMVFSMLPVSAFATDLQTEETDTTVTEPALETTAPVTEETEEVSAETTAESAEEVPQIETVSTGTYVPTVSTADSDELLEGWMYQQFYGGVSLYGVAARAQLNDCGKVLYDGLKAEIEKIAAGSRVSTKITADVSAAGGSSWDDFQINEVMDALLHDCPYDLYWYDKTSATSYSAALSSGTFSSITVSMPVTADLQGSSAYEADVSGVNAAAAVEAAQSIVAKYASSGTYEKLVGYKTEICALVEYNDAAAESGSFSLDADPWQLLWVFDGDPATSVVCEGYSKAFQYLCDLDGGIDCYTVTGNMATANGGGGHMWNIVSLNDKNYLVDVTNSDSGTIGQSGGLFLNGCTGSVADGYTFSTAGGDVVFTYGGEMITLWGSDGILVLSETEFDPDSVTEPSEPEETEPEETEPETTEPETTEPEAVTSGTCGDSAYWAFDEATGTLTISGTGAMYDKGDAVPWVDHKANVTKVIVEEGITYIGIWAFGMHDNLTSAVLSSTVEEIGGLAFYMCCNLTDLTIGSGLKVIGGSAFEHCCALTSLTLPDSLTTLENYAISSCHSLTEITIPASVGSIAECALGACSTLEKITFAGSAPQINENAFMGTTATVYYPADDATWTDDMFQNYGGTLTWVAYGEDPEPTESTDPSESTEPAETDYELTFINTLTGSTIVLTVEDGKVPELPEAGAVKGYDFIGWFSSRNGTGTRLAQGDTWYADMATTWYAYYVESVEDTVCTLSVYMLPVYADGSTGSRNLVCQTEFEQGADVYAWLTGESGVATIQNCVPSEYTWEEPGVYYNYFTDELLTELTADGNMAVYIKVAAPAAEEMTPEQFLAVLEEAAASGEDYYLKQSVTLTGDLTIDQNVWIFLFDGGSITVPAGCSLTIGADTHLVVMNGGSVTIDGTLNAAEHLSMQITTGALTVSDSAVWNVPGESVHITLGSALVSAPVSVMATFYVRASAATAEELKNVLSESPAYGFVDIGVNQSMTLDWDVAIPDNVQLGIGNGSGTGVVTVTVPSGCTLTNNGWIFVDEGCLLLVEAGGTLVNNQSIELQEDTYINNGTEVNNGSIHMNRFVDSVPELIEALAEAGTAASEDNYPTVYLNDDLTMVSGDSVSIPANVTLIVNALLTMESGSTVTIQQGGTLMTGLYGSDVLKVLYGAAVHNYGQLYLHNGNSSFAEDTYVQYQGGMVDLYPDASVTGIDPALIDYNIRFATEEALAESLALAQTGTYGSYTVAVEYGIPGITLSGTHVIPANTIIDVYNGTNLELLSGADVTNNGTIYLFYGSTLTIPEDAALTNNGTIYNYGGTINGTVTGNQPNQGGGSVSSSVTDEASLREALETDSGEDIYIGGEIKLTSSLTIDAESSVLIPSGASIVVPSGKTLTIKSNVYLYGGSIIVEKGGKLAVTGDGWIQNLAGAITNEGTVTVSATSGGIWEYVCYGASSTGIDKSLIHGVSYAISTEDVLAGLDAAAEGYGVMEIVADGTFTLTESVTIPANAVFVTAWLEQPVEVTIPAGVTLINNGMVMVFEGTALLVEAGGAVVNNGYMEVFGTYINSGTHTGNDAIEDVTPDYCGENLTYTLENGILTISGTGDMYDYSIEMAPWYAYDMQTQIREVVIEEGVTSISHSAFALCSNLEKVTIASSVASIGGLSFQDCTALTSITFTGGAPEIGENAFYNVTADVYYPSADRTWDRGRGQYGGTLNWIPYGPNSGTCGENLTWVLDETTGTLIISGTGEMDDYYDPMLADETLSPWRHLKESIRYLVIEEGVTNVTEFAFYNYPNLETVTLPEGLTAIANNAFDSLLKLTEITIPGGVTSVDTAAFYGCTALEKIIFTGDAPYINAHAFTGVAATVYYPGANATWTGDKLLNYGGNLNWVPVYDLDQAGLDSLIDDAGAYITQEITLTGDVTICREDVQIIFAADSSLTVPAGVTLTIQSNVLFAGKLYVEEGGAVVVENAADQSGETWITLCDIGGAEVNGALAVGEYCSFITNDGAETVITKTGIVNNYGTFCAEANGNILVGGVINNYGFLAVYNQMTVDGTLNNFAYTGIEAYGEGVLNVNGLLVNKDEIVIHAGANLQLSGDLNNHGRIHQYKADDGSEESYFVVSGTMVNDETGELHLYGCTVVRGVLENYGYLLAANSLYVEKPGTLSNGNRSVENRGYIIIGSSGELTVAGRMNSSGDIDNFGSLLIDQGEATIGGTICNNAALNVGHYYGGTLTLTGTLYNDGSVGVNHSIVDGAVYDGILNIEGEFVNRGMLAVYSETNVTGALSNNTEVYVSGDAAVLTIDDGAILTNDSFVTVDYNGRLIVEDEAVQNLHRNIDLGIFGIIEGVSDSDVDLEAMVYTEEDLYYVLAEQAAKHTYSNENIRVYDPVTFDGVELEDGTVVTELVVPEDTCLRIMADYGEVLFTAGTKLINNGNINIGSSSCLHIAQNAVLENNGSINPYDGWLIVDGEQTGEGTLEVPEEAWVTTETELQAAVAMGVKTIYVQSAASTYARTVSTLTLTENLTIPEGTQVVVLGVMLTISEGVTLTVEGSVVITDGAAVTVDGVLANNASGRIGLDCVSGSLTFSETGSYEAAAGAEITVGNDFTIESSGADSGIPEETIIQQRWVVEFTWLSEIMTAAAEDLSTCYHVYVNESLTLEADLTIPENVTLIIRSGVILSVPALVTLYNQGVINVEDGGELYINGQYSYVQNGGTLNVAENGRFTTEFPTADTITLYANGNPGNVTVGVGETVALTAEVLPALAADQELIWELEGTAAEWSDFEAKQLTAVEAGEAVVRVTATDGTGLSAEITVTVTDCGIQITADSNRVLGGNSIKLTAQWVPGNQTGTGFVWSLAEGDTSFATLKASGSTATITAADVTEVQTVTVIAEAKDGTAAPCEFKLTIVPKVKAVTLYDVTSGEESFLWDSILLDNGFENGFSIILKAAVEPAGASADMTWKSYDEGVAYIVEDDTLDAGCAYLFFTGQPGAVKITATAADGSKASVSWTFHLVEPVAIEAVGDTEIDLVGGKSATLKIQNADTGKTLKASYWYISAFDAEGNYMDAAPYASISTAGKLITKAVSEMITLQVYGGYVVDGCPMGEVVYTVNLYPAVANVEIYQGLDLVNGKTLYLDVAGAEEADAPSLNLIGKVYPADAMNDIAWKSSSTKIAAVENGIVTFGGKTGTVTITATASNGKKANVKVEVGAMTEQVTVTAPAETLTSGKSMTLSAATVPAKPTKSGVTWSIVEGTSYAKISSSGKLTAQTVYAPQQVTVVATSKDAAQVVSKPVTVTILPKAAETLNLMIGSELVTKTTLSAEKDDTIELSAWMFFNDPEAEEEPVSVTWKSSKTGVAALSVEEGKKTTVTVKGTGSATITATGYNSGNKKVTATVTVKAGVLSTGVEVTSTVNTVASGKSITLKASTVPANVTTKGVVWSLAPGDEAYAKISSSGKLTANKDLTSAKNITVLVQAKDGNSPAVEIPVTITPLSTSVQIFMDDTNVTGSTWTWSVLDGMKLSAKVYPFYGYGENRDQNADQAVAWKSSNTKILDIDAKGNVTFGSKYGTVTITATASDSSGKKAAFKVTTFKPVTELEISDGWIAGGKTLKLSTLTTKITEDASSKKLYYAITGGDGAAFASITSAGVLKTKKVTSTKIVEIIAWDEYGYTSEEFTVAITPATTKVNLLTMIDGEYETVTSQTIELAAGKTVQVVGSSNPNFAYEDYTWKVSNVKYAGIWDYGEDGEKNLSATQTGPGIVVEGITPGKTVTITATANDGTGKKVTMKIEIVEPE